MVVFIEIVALCAIFIILFITGVYAFYLTNVSKEKLIAFIVSEKKFLKEIKMLFIATILMTVAMSIQFFYVLITGDIYLSNPETNKFALLYLPFMLLSLICICIPIVKWARRVKIYD